MTLPPSYLPSAHTYTNNEFDVLKSTSLLKPPATFKHTVIEMQVTSGNDMITFEEIWHW